MQHTSSSFICQEHIQHNVQEKQVAYSRCNKAEVQH